MIENFNIVLQQSNLTVMTRYEEQPRDAQRYQSEAYYRPARPEHSNYTLFISYIHTFPLV